MFAVNAATGGFAGDDFLGGVAGNPSATFGQPKPLCRNGSLCRASIASRAALAVRCSRGAQVQFERRPTYVRAILVRHLGPRGSGTMRFFS